MSADVARPRTLPCSRLEAHTCASTASPLTAAIQLHYSTRSVLIQSIYTRLGPRSDDRSVNVVSN